MNQVEKMRQTLQLLERIEQREMEEGMMKNIGMAAAIAGGLMGAPHAAAQPAPQSQSTVQRDLSHFSTEYLQNIADGKGGMAMVSKTDAVRELADRASGKSKEVRDVAPDREIPGGLAAYYRAHPGIR